MASPARFVISFSTKLAAGHYCPAHSHKVLEIVFHPVGSGRVKTGSGEELRFADGDVVVHPPGIEHDQRMESAGVDHCLHIAVDDPELSRRLGSSFVIRSVRSESVLLELGSIFHWLSDDSDSAKDFRAASLLHSLIYEMERSAGCKPESTLYVAAQAWKIASSETREAPSVKEIACRLGVSSDYLRHIFKRHFGRGLKDFSLEARMARAKELLINSPMGLKAIAAECGFDSERALCSVFKRRAGSTPIDYRLRFKS